MKLYILRHGDAVEHGDPRYNENARPLTRKGVQRTRQLAHALRRMRIRFDVIRSSPLVRAKQTAEIVARGLRQEFSLTDALKPSANLRELVEDLNALGPVAGSVLLVGHEPYLGNFVSLICTGGLDLPLKLKKGGLVRLEVEHLSPAKCAVLEWLIQPRLFSGRSARSVAE